VNAFTFGKKLSQTSWAYTMSITIYINQTTC